MLPIPPVDGRVRFDTYEPRNVQRTLEAQLKVAMWERRGANENASSNNTGASTFNIDAKSIAALRSFLKKESALKLPPAISTLEGIGSKPFRLYSAVGLDLLHTFDLGISRQFCDDTFRVFMDQKYSGTRTKASLIRVANRRIHSLPYESGCRSYTPFRNTEKDKQASFTGKQRRQLCPFLWVAVVGLSENKEPDNDELFQVALGLDFIQSELRGVNKSKEQLSRTALEINLLQKKVAKYCDMFQALFSTNESTKLHRLRVHLMEQFLDFGNIRVSDTAANETLHKGIKRSYYSTNKHMESINRQLLQVNAAASVQEGMFESVPDNLLLTRDKTSIYLPSKPIFNSRQSFSLPFKSEKVAVEMDKLIMEFNRNNDHSPKETVAMLSLSRDSFNCYLYTKKKYVDIQASFEWTDTSVKVRQRLFATDSYSKSITRYDAIVYVDDTGKQIFGIVEAFFLRNETLEYNFGGATVAVVRQLQKIHPDMANSKIVREFGYTRVSFVKSSTDIVLVCVPATSIRRRLVLVPDWWDLTCRYGHEVALETLPDTAAERRRACFFIARNFVFTSVGESVLGQELDE